ncbi:hypothetical protein [Salinibacter ruber]|uniref:hypothetical protein n=1 Tax=Salinibacter ruber TaxID=146919 RepID=UPI002168AC5F|nr:hypothetical protein [Salinibacter ruber]MCS3639819.1 uncharacterized protein YceK [Salinibacter ruber]
MKRSLYTTVTSYLTLFAFAGIFLLSGCTSTVSGPQASEEKPVEVRQGQDHNTMQEDGGTTNPKEPHNTSPNE